MVTRVEVRGRNNTEFEIVRDMVSGSFVKRTADMSAPTANIVINNRDGIWSQRFRRNDFVRIYDHEQLVFDGKLFETKKNDKVQQLVVTVWKKEYMDLYDTICMEADQQNGYTPWNWGSEEVLEGGNATLATEGLRPDEIFKAGLGLTTEIQHFFSETDAILLTEINSSLQTSGFGSRSNQKSLEIAHLTETSYYSDATVVTRTLTNGLVGYNTSPDVSTVRIRLSGVEPAGTDVQIRVSIDDGITWSSAQSPVYNSSTGLWADATFSSIPNNGTDNLVKVEIKLLTNGGTADATPRIRYMRATFTHPVSDTGVTAGTIDTYVDPDTDNNTAGGDYNKRNRLEVVQGAVKATVAPAGEQYTHWIAFIDENGAAHFRDPSTYNATESSVVFSREGGTCDDIDVTTVGQIINNIVYVGTGIGGGTLVITETNGYTAGILRNAASILQYGEIQGMVTEKNVFSIAHADKRARSIARLLSQEQKAIEVTLNPNDDLDLEIGQKVRALSTKLDLNLVVRILAESFDFTAEGIIQRHVVLGNNIPSVNNVLAALRRGIESQNLTEQGARSPPSVSFHDNVDNTHPAEMAFYIPEDARIRKIGIHLKTKPFRTFSEITAAGSAHTHVVTGGAAAAGAAGLLRRDFVDKSGTLTNPEVGNQALAGDVANKNINTQPSISGSTATQSIPGQTLLYYTTDPSQTVAASTLYNISDTGPSGSTSLSNYEGFMVTGTFYNQTSGADWYLSLQFNDGAVWRVAYTTELKDCPGAGKQYSVSLWFPSSYFLASGITDIAGVRMQLGNDGGGDQAITSVQAAINVVHRHAHPNATLANNGGDIVGGLSGNTAPTNMDPDLLINAATLQQLLADARLGYRSDSGGVGAIIFTQDAVDYYDNHNHVISGTALGPESEHIHKADHGIFEFDEVTTNNPSGIGIRYPKDVQVFIRGYPTPASNNWDGTVANLSQLNAPFDRFGTRGRYDQSIEVQNMDVSVAFRNVDGTFKTGFQQVWVRPATDASHGNTKGLGRFDAHLFIEQQLDVEK